MKTRTLGSGLPGRQMQQACLSDARIYRTGLNICARTGDLGLDPTIRYTNGNWHRNVDFARFPHHAPGRSERTLWSDASAPDGLHLPRRLPITFLRSANRLPII